MQTSEFTTKPEKGFLVSIISGGKKTANLRFPSDQEWCDRVSKMKSVQHNLGRGKSQSAPGNGVEASAELFDKVYLGDNPEQFDTAEKARFIDRIDLCEITEVSRDGDTFRIEMRVPGATVTHVLGMPTAKDTMEFGRAAVPPAIQDRRTTEIRFRLAPSGTLWDKVKISVSGYMEGSAVPIIHKDAAITELLNQIREAEDEDPEL